MASDDTRRKSKNNGQQKFQIAIIQKMRTNTIRSHCLSNTSRPHNTCRTLDSLIFHDLLGEITDSTESSWDSSKPSFKVNLLPKSFPRSSTSGADLVDVVQRLLIDLIVCHHSQSLHPYHSLFWSCLLYFPKAQAWASLTAPTAHLKASESWVFRNHSLVKYVSTLTVSIQPNSRTMQNWSRGWNIQYPSNATSHSHNTFSQFYWSTRAIIVCDSRQNR